MKYTKSTINAVKSLHKISLGLIKESIEEFNTLLEAEVLEEDDVLFIANENQHRILMNALSLSIVKKDMNILESAFKYIEETPAPVAAVANKGGALRRAGTYVKNRITSGYHIAKGALMRRAANFQNWRANRVSDKAAKLSGDAKAAAEAKAARLRQSAWDRAKSAEDSAGKTTKAIRAAKKEEAAARAEASRRAYMQ